MPPRTLRNEADKLRNERDDLETKNATLQRELDRILSGTGPLRRLFLENGGIQPSEAEDGELGPILEQTAGLRLHSPGMAAQPFGGGEGVLPWSAQAERVSELEDSVRILTEELETERERARKLEGQLEDKNNAESAVQMSSAAQFQRKRDESQDLRPKPDEETRDKTRKQTSIVDLEKALSTEKAQAQQLRERVEAKDEEEVKLRLQFNEFRTSSRQLKDQVRKEREAKEKLQVQLDETVREKDRLKEAAGDTKKSEIDIVKRLRDERDELKAKVKRRDDTAERLQKERNEVQQKLEEAKKESSDQTKLAGKARKDLEKLNDALRSRAEKGEGEVQRLGVELQNSTRDKDKLETLADAHATKLSQLQSSNAQLASRIATLEKEKTTLELDLKSSRSESGTRIDALAKLGEQLKASQESVDELRGQVESKDKELREERGLKGDAEREAKEWKRQSLRLGQTSKDQAGKIEGLQKELRELKEANTKLSADLETKRQEVEDLRIDLVKERSTSADSEDVSKTVSQLLRQMDSMKELSSELAEQVRTKDAQFRDVEVKLGTLTKEKEDLNSRLLGATNESSRQTSRIEHVERELKVLRESESQSSTRAQGLERQVKAVTREKEEVDGRVRDLTTQIATKDSELQGLNAALIKQKTEADRRLDEAEKRFRDTTCGSGAQVMAMTERLQSLQTANNKLTADIEAKERDVRELKTSNNGLTADVETKSKQVGELKMKLDTAAEEKERAARRLRDMALRWDARTKTIEQLEVDVQNKTHELDLRIKEKEEVESSIEEMKSQTQSQATTIDKLQRELREVQSSTSSGISQFTSQITALKGEVAAGLRQKGDLERLIHEMTNQCQTQATSIEKLQKEIREMQSSNGSEVSQFNSQIAALRSEFELAKHQKGDLERQLQNLKGKHKTLEDEKSRFEERAQTLRNQLEMAEGEKMSLEGALKAAGTQSSKQATTIKKLEAAKHTLATQLKEAENASKLLQQNLEEVYRDYTHKLNKVQELYQPLLQIQEQYESQRTELDTLIGANKNLEAELADKAERVAQLERSTRPLSESQAVVELNTRIKAQEKEITKWRGEVFEQDRKVQDAQKAAEKLLNRDRHIVIDDGKVRSMLSNEYMPLPKVWAKANAIRKVEAAENRSYESQPLRGELEKVAVAMGDGMPERLIKQFPQILVHALLSQYVAEKVFQQPFLPLDSEETRQKSFSENLMDLYETFLEVDLPEAHLWRSQTLQLLARIRTPTRASGTPQSGHFTQTSLSVIQTAYCTRLAQSFVAGPVKPFLRPNPDVTDLIDLLKQADNISSQLWKQRVALHVRGWGEIKDTRFTCRARDMEAHPLHRLEDDDMRLDGKRIVLVVAPAVVAYGNEDAERYGEVKVWSKAVIALEA